MYGTIFKIQKSILLALVLFISTAGIYCQEPNTFRYLKLTLGGGYGHYFNTFTNVQDEDVRNNHPSYFAKLLWHPEHRLRIGLESGYYYIYSTTRIETTEGSEKLTTHLKVMPIFLSVSMKIVKNLELNFGTGWASMFYTVDVNNNKSKRVAGHTFSMSNYTAGFTYLLPLGKRFDLGTEFKYLYLGKTNDYHISGFLFMSYKFKRWPVK